MGIDNDIQYVIIVSMEFTAEEKKVFSRMGKARFIGKTPEEISKMMSEVRRKGIENKKQPQIGT